MKRPILIAVVTAFAIGAAFVSTSASADANGQSGLAAVRAATAKFHDVSAAIASGRNDLHLCVDQMGQHYADPNTFSDGILDPTNPEAMVYADDGSGHLHLGAVEWVSTTPGEVPGIGPLHLNPALGVYVLHAWIWTPNPDGMFADMNPQVGNCPS
jgi:hypothetical protein